MTRTAIRTAVIVQKGPLFVVVNEKDNRIMNGPCNQDKMEKISAQGQHRIARTGYPGQDNRTALLDRTLKQPGNSLYVHKNLTMTARTVYWILLLYTVYSNV